MDRSDCLLESPAHRAASRSRSRRWALGRPSRKDKIVQPDYSEGIQIKTEDEDPRFNNALARGLAILRAFQIDLKLLGNLEIAELTGLAKSTVSRLTFTLTQLGYLHYRPEFGKYELAAGVIALAYPYLASQTVPPVARPLMVELALKTKTNVGLGVHEGLSVLYLEYALGEADPNRLQRPGFRVPLVRTAMGRACIAAMRPEARQQFYLELREHYKREWSRLYDELEDAAAQVQTRGFCIAAGTFRPTTNSVAVPFVHGDGHTIMAFNSQGHSQTQTQEVMLRNGKRLLDLATEVRRRLAEATHGPSLGH
jgi:DNA-binding IclR family transcriptional regulator